MTTPTQEEVNVFLDNLRESGVTNMWGATPYIEEHFEVNYEESKEFLITWMDTFSERHNENEEEANDEMKFVRTVKNDDDHKQALFEVNGKYFMYSYVNNEHANETMVFPADKNGEIMDYRELDSVHGYINSAVIMKSDKSWAQ